jgi:uncharacterized membrane-anchored protein
MNLTTTNPTMTEAPPSGLDAWIARVPLALRAALAALILCGLIGAMVRERAAILSGGREVRLATAPVDPRDLFRGDYVVLTYDISRLRPGRLGLDGPLALGERVHVTLRPGPDGLAQAVAMSRAAPAPAAGDVVIEGRVADSRRCMPPPEPPRQCSSEDEMVRVTYGLESYFVPQGEGLAIERTPRARMEVVAAVAPSGKAAIKRLLIDGKKVYDEPPY